MKDSKEPKLKFFSVKIWGLPWWCTISLSQKFGSSFFFNSKSFLDLPHSCTPKKENFGKEELDGADFLGPAQF